MYISIVYTKYVIIICMECRYTYTIIYIVYQIHINCNTDNILFVNKANT